MSIQELLPIVRALTGDEKRRLREWLEAELTDEARPMTETLPPGEYHLASPEPAYDAAHKLNLFLESERAKAQTR